jgi:hypothetical protein
MLENQISAEKNELWRMPHTLRALVMQNVLFDSNTQEQIRLKDIITRHALAAALRQVESINRQTLLTTLKDMREVSPFKEIREILVEHELLLSGLETENEPKAALILKEIARLANPKDELPDRFTPAHRVALRALDQFDSDIYARRLRRVFPALDPEYSPKTAPR